MRWLRRREEPRPEQLAWQLLLTAGRPDPAHKQRPDPDEVSTQSDAVLTAAMTEPAAVRYVFDFDADGYLLRGSLEKSPGPFPPATGGHP